jgi:hypothetical protein
MASWTRRKLIQAALAAVTVSLTLLQFRSRGARAQSCEELWSYDYDGTCVWSEYSSPPPGCNLGGGGGVCYFWMQDAGAC